MFTIRRIQRSGSNGLSVHDPTDSVFTIHRNAQAGLGHIAQSWVGNGPNQSVSPQQLQTVLGDNQVQSMASQAGMGSQDFLSQLSQHLPNVVHGMTPNGQLADEGSISV